MMLTFGGRGTNSHVLFSVRVLYSSSIAIFQFESRRANTGLRGKGDLDSNVRRLKDFLGL